MIHTTHTAINTLLQSKFEHVNSLYCQFTASNDTHPAAACRQAWAQTCGECSYENRVRWTCSLDVLTPHSCVHQQITNEDDCRLSRRLKNKFLWVNDYKQPQHESPKSLKTLQQSQVSETWGFHAGTTIFYQILQMSLEWLSIFQVQRKSHYQLTTSAPQWQLAAMSFRGCSPHPHLAELTPTCNL